MDEINKLQNKIIREILKGQRDLDERSLKLIATRLNSIKGLGLVDLFDLAYFNMIYTVMAQMTADVEKTRQRQVKSLENLLLNSAKSSYNSMKSLYADGGKKFVSYKNNPEIRDFIKSSVTSNCSEFDSTLKGVGYPVKSGKTGKLVFNSIPDTYQSVANEAKNYELSNPQGYEMWSKGIIRQLLKSGLKIYNYNQDTHRYKQQNSYSYIRNFIKDAVYKVCQGIYNIVANQVGIDGVEISVHVDSALDHLPVQGHQFTLEQFRRMQSGEDFYDVDGEKFIGLDRIIGVWNCRHLVFPVILGKTKPQYTKEQLKNIIKNTKEYTSITTIFGESVPITYGEYLRQLTNLQDKVDKFNLGLHVAEKFGNQYLIDYYKSKLGLAKNALDVLKLRI